MGDDTTITVTIPSEIVFEIERRCREFGVTVQDIVAAVLLEHLNWKTTDTNIGWKLLDRLEDWKAGDRKIHRWQTTGD